MGGFEGVLAAILVAAVGLNVVAIRIGVPYPIVLVLGGLVLALVPGMPHVEMEPDLVLVVFLPPLLYVAAFFAEPVALRTYARALSLTAIGLVLVTMTLVAVAGHAVLGLSWPMAFALGAIVSPTDPVAATAIMRRLGAPRRIVPLVEGESLVNDAAALVAYRVALAAAVEGTFSLSAASLEFVGAVFGGIAVGIAVGFVIGEIRRRVEDVPTEITITLLTGYAAFLPAEQLHLSGVLAVVTAGVYLGWRAPELAAPATRLQAFAVWQVVSFLLNAALFILIGLQLPIVTDGLSGEPPLELAGYAALISATVIGARFAWNVTVPYLLRGSRPTPVRPLPGRDLIVFVAFGVVLVTVVGQDLTLPWLIRRLGVADEGREEQHEEQVARLQASKAALQELDAVRAEGWAADDVVDDLHHRYLARQKLFAARAGLIEDDGYGPRFDSHQQVLRRIYDAERRAVIGLRNRGDISNEVMHRIERELDLEEVQLEP